MKSMNMLFWILCLYLFDVYSQSISNCAIHFLYSDAYKERVTILEKDVKTYQKTIADINKDMDTKDKRAKFLEEQIKAQERKYIGELKGKEQIITSLNSELEHKASMISTLTMKIREMKKEARSVRETKSPRVHNTSKPETSSPRDLESQTPVPAMPAPPRDAPPKQRHYRRSVGHASLSQSGVKNRPPSSRKLEDRPNSGNSSDSMPDPTPFLRLATSENEPTPRVKRSEKAILPPIISSSDNPLSMPMLLPMSADSDKFMKGSSRQKERVSSSSPEIEVETLAVDQVKSRRHALRQAREYNTSSDCWVLYGHLWFSPVMLLLWCKQAFYPYANGTYAHFEMSCDIVVTMNCCVLGTFSSVGVIFNDICSKRNVFILCHRLYKLSTAGSVLM